jgi:hypothetical protein
MNSIETILMRKKRLQTTVSPEVYDKIQKLRAKYGSVSKVVESAIEKLERGEVQIEESDYILLEFIKKFDFVVSSKDIFKYLVEGDVDRAVKESAVELSVEYFLKKSISEAELIEVLETLKVGWESLHRATYIEIVESDSKIKFLFYHDLQSTKYSELHFKLLRLLFDKYFEQKYEYSLETLTPNGFSVVFREHSN